jgi:hypothetical protein
VNGRGGRVKRILALLIVVFAMAAAPMASADSTVLSGYGTTGSRAVVEVKGASAPKPATATASTLPFTGSDLTMFVAAGIALAGVGLGMRRLAREKE